MYKSHLVFQLQPGASERENLRESYYTGVPSIDLLFPIGKGQNVLLVDGKEKIFTEYVISGLLKNSFVFNQAIIVSQRSLVGIAPESKNILVINNEIAEADIECDYFLNSYLSASLSLTDDDTLVIYEDFHLFTSLWERAERLVETFTKNSVGIDRSSLRHYYSSLIQRSANFTADCGNGSLTFVQCFARENKESKNLHIEELKSLSDSQIVLQDTQGVPKLDIKNSFSRIGVGSNKFKNKDIRYKLISSKVPNFRLSLLADLDEATFTGRTNSSILWRYLFNKMVHINPIDLLLLSRLIRGSLIKSITSLDHFCSILFDKK